MWKNIDISLYYPGYSSEKSPERKHLGVFIFANKENDVSFLAQHCECFFKYDILYRQNLIHLKHLKDCGGLELFTTSSLQRLRLS